MNKPLANLIALAAALAAMGAPTAAFAHPGHGTGGGLAAGFLHPLTGADHLAAMVLAGVWAGMLRGRERLSRAWALPLGFCAAMLAGFVAAPWFAAGLAVSLAETLVTASVVALAALAVLRLCPPLPVELGALALFGFGHGLAHGMELPDGAAPWRFVAGFLAASALLQGVGMALSRLVPARLVPARRRLPPSPRQP